MLDSALRYAMGEYVRERYAADPVAATVAGIHDHDARLTDLTADGFAARDRIVDAYLARFEAVPEAELSPALRTDRALALASLAGERILRPFERWRRQPSLYSDAIVRGAYYALIREETPADERLGALAERLAQAPAALEAARANLEPDRIPPVWVVVAGETAANGATFVRAVLPTVAEGPAKAALAAAGKRAGDALDAYASWLRDDLMRRARGTFAVGHDAFDALLRERELLPYDAASLLARGKDLYAETESRLREAARALGDADWRASVARLREDHPGEEELVDTYRREMEGSRRATEVAALAAMPPDAELVVEEMPAFQRSTYPYAAYIAPGPFERSRRGRFWVTVPFAGDPPQTRRERLEGHPRAGIPVIACHEGFPGHHLQLATAASLDSLARKVFRSNVFVEGWGLYVEELMTELGYLGSAETRLLRTKDLLWRAARVLVDVGLHTGELTFEAAVNLMVEGPKLERPNAVGEVRRYTQDPLQPSSYALGREAILRLRERAKRKGWGMREFHDRLLATGSLPPALAERETGL
ncbi:MAG TPA: DUF885 domain-containing protein [Candidatus Limnocylindria bacterium]|nr:DUF885 domain-containing protein [Candidatus Limnocylindria bacterium]